MPRIARRLATSDGEARDIAVRDLRVGKPIEDAQSRGNALWNLEAGFSKLTIFEKTGIARSKLGVNACRERRRNKAIRIQIN